jgi:hypothetical protein
MSEEESRFAADKIMFNCAALFGCPLPQTEGFAEIISKELFLFLNEFGYSELTLEEIMLAMRINAKGNLKYPSGMEVEQVQFHGSCFHVDFISRILSYYMTMRGYLDSTLRNFLDGY